ncbi:MAG: hypothetical protein ACXWP5_11960 [Bdellovibrionota bacterium]
MSATTQVRFSAVDWIDPSLLSSFQYGAVTDGQRTILVGYLDLSQFPTVEELQTYLASAPEARGA